jgi:hypothetical protein
MAFPSDQSGFTNSYRRMPNKSDTQARAPHGREQLEGKTPMRLIFFHSVKLPGLEDLVG